jgi:predicted lipoprotein with Yx(FWY)xxD motif
VKGRGAARWGVVLAALGLALSACTSNPVVNGTPTTRATPAPRAATLSVAASPAGSILTTGAGYTLYDFVPDTPTSSACVSVTCVFLWPPLVVTGPVTLGPGLKASLVGTIRRPDGATQVTYGGHPLYTYNSDVRPGMVTGQAIDQAGGLWYVVAPSGQQITTPFSVDS